MVYLGRIGRIRPIGYVIPFCLFYFDLEQNSGFYLKIYLENFFSVKLIICPARSD